MKQLPQPTNSSDILAMLGDTADPDYPIYRTATGPDGAATLATGKPSLLLVWYKGWDQHILSVHYIISTWMYMYDILIFEWEKERERVRGACTREK